MSQDDTDSIRARAEAATEGPWVHLVVEDGDECGPTREERPTRHWSTPDAASEDVWFGADTPADAAFIAASRTDVPALLALLDEARAARDAHFAARNMLGARVDRLEAQLAEVRRTSRVLPCDGLCSDYPEEDCSLHGREPAELWEALLARTQRAETAEAELAEARGAIERVKALIDDMQRLALPGMTDWDYAEDFRAALDPADTTNERGEA